MWFLCPHVVADCLAACWLPGCCELSTKTAVRLFGYDAVEYPLFVRPRPRHCQASATIVRGQEAECVLMTRAALVSPLVVGACVVSIPVIIAALCVRDSHLWDPELHGP